ncbi:MAG TPA: class I SAM-dependent methyltransferase [Acidimicrobiia bacterium]
MDASAWDQRYTEADRLWRREPNEVVATEVDRLTPGRALDLAAGEGRHALFLAERGWEVVAVDFSRVAIGKGMVTAQESGLEITWVVDDVLSYRPHGVFDLVLMSYLQLPEASMRSIVAGAELAVGPGGTLLIVAHALGNLDGGYGGPQDPALLYEPEQAASWITSLEVDRAEHITRKVDTEEGPRTAIDLILRAVRHG